MLSRRGAVGVYFVKVSCFSAMGSLLKAFSLILYSLQLFYRCRWVESCKGGVSFFRNPSANCNKSFYCRSFLVRKNSNIPCDEKAGVGETRRRTEGEREEARASREECVKKWGDKKCDTELPLPSFPPEYCRARTGVEQPTWRPQTMRISRCSDMICF